MSDLPYVSARGAGRYWRNMNVSATPSAAIGNLFSSARDGIHRAVTKANSAGEQLANGELDAEPLIDLDQAALLVKLNTAALRTGDEMFGSLLNVKR